MVMFHDRFSVHASVFDLWSPLMLYQKKFMLHREIFSCSLAPRLLVHLSPLRLDIGFFVFLMIILGSIETARRFMSPSNQSLTKQTESSYACRMKFFYHHPPCTTKMMI